MKIINSDKVPEALGPYSHATVINGFVFTSGQIPLNPSTGELVTEIKAATKQSLENIKAILEAAGTSLENVVKTVVYIKNMNDFGDVNEVYGEYFKENAPARSCVEVARLPKDALVEIEAIAIMK